jgi:hypothetical protein
MHPHSVTFGGGANETVLNPFVLVAMLAAMVLFFTLPRKFVIIPLLLTIFLIPEGQEFYVAGVHLFVNRLLILVAFIRAMGPREPNQRERFAGGWTSIDTAFVCYVGLVAVSSLLQYMTVAAVIYQLGYVWDYLLGYLVLRSFVQNERDSAVVVKCFAVLMVLIGTGMLIEQLKMLNVFGLLGGVASVPEVREGKIRSQGVFQHSLTAGTFAATAIPLFILLWRSYKARLFAITGIVAATAMTITTQTSTSLLTQAGGVLAILMWPVRKQMKKVRIGLVALIVALDLVMKAPVWFLIARIDLTGSSSSYHRAELIDQFVNHFSSWWLMGTKDAATWGWDMWDAQNMYVSVGEAGGLAALIFYILVISRSFGRLGAARRRTTLKKQEWMIWLLGTALFAHVVAFFGVNYFDQSRVAWFALISMICACTAPTMKRASLSGTTNITVTVKTPHEGSIAADAPYAQAPALG